MRVVPLTLILLLAAGCESFHVPASQAFSRRGTPPLRRCTTTNRHRSSRVLAAPDAKVGSKDLGEIASGEIASGEIASGEIASEEIISEEIADAPPPFTPSFFWWTKNRVEENRMLNLAANAGFLAAVALVTAAMVFGVNWDDARGWTLGEYFLRVPLDNWQGYLGALRDRPVQVKACTSGIVYALGDWVAQTVEGVELSDIKRERVLISALAGLLLHGPLSHVWYNLCEVLFDFLDWNDYWWVTGPKIITDQLLWGPTWNAVYITFLGVVKKDSFETIWEAITSTAIPLMLAGIRLWPLAHIVTYGLVPKENRLLWVDAVEIVWVTILSKQAAEQARSTADKEEAGPH